MSKINKALLGIAALLTLNSANAQDSSKTAEPVKDNFQGNVEFIGSLKDQGTSYIRPNIFYGLPGGIEGYFFMEMYNHGTVFGKNSLSKKVFGNVSIMDQIVYGTGTPTQTSLGWKVEGPLSEKTFLSLYVLPAYIDGRGRVMRKKAVIGGTVDANLPFGIKIWGFGEYDIGNKLSNYGELCVQKSFGDVAVGYNPAFQPHGAGVTTEHRLNFNINLK